MKNEFREGFEFARQIAISSVSPGERNKMHAAFARYENDERLLDAPPPSASVSTSTQPAPVGSAAETEAKFKQRYGQDGWSLQIGNGGN